MNTIKAKLTEAQRLGDQLDKSMLIQQIWPEAFKAGRCTVHATGKYSNALGRHGQWPYKAYIKTGDGTMRWLTAGEYQQITGRDTHPQWEVVS